MQTFPNSSTWFLIGPFFRRATRSLAACTRSWGGTGGHSGVQGGVRGESQRKRNGNKTGNKEKLVFRVRESWGMGVWGWGRLGMASHTHIHAHTCTRFMGCKMLLSRLTTSRDTRQSYSIQQQTARQHMLLCHLYSWVSSRVRVTLWHAMLWSY